QDHGLVDLALEGGVPFVDPHAGQSAHGDDGGAAADGGGIVEIDHTRIVGILAGDVDGGVAQKPVLDTVRRLGGAVAVVLIWGAEGRRAGELREQGAHGQGRDVHAVAAADDELLFAFQGAVGYAGARPEVEQVRLEDIGSHAGFLRGFELDVE